MAKKKIEYVLQGAQDAAEGRNMWSSGVPRMGWQYDAWKTGYDQYFNNQPKEPAKVIPVDTTIVRKNLTVPRRSSDHFRRCDRMLASLKRKAELRAI